MKFSKAFLFVAILVSLIFADTLPKDSENKSGYGIRFAPSIWTVGSINGEHNIYSPSFAIGLIKNFSIYKDIIMFNPELNLILRTIGYKSYENKLELLLEYEPEKYELSEYAVGISALIKAMPFGGPWFYMETGVFLNIPFGTEIKRDGEEWRKYNEREKLDFGVIFPLSFGWNIGEKFSLGARLSASATEINKDLKIVDKYGEDEYNYFVQFEIGLNYWF